MEKNGVLGVFSMIILGNDIIQGTIPKTNRVGGVKMFSLYEIIIKI